MRVLELGNYIVPAYAGMVLAEQGHEVIKWTNGRDPTLDLWRGDELWAWLNEGKQLENVHPVEVKERGGEFDAVMDNFRPGTLAKWQLDPGEIAERFGLIWVSVRSEVGETSFDILAQCRSWMEYAPWIPFYVGDTTAGLWLAFKVAACRASGHYVIGHASCLQKMVEGELIVEVDREPGTIPWDREAYEFVNGKARVVYRDQVFEEVPRTRAWKMEHLWHNGGRICI